MFFISDAIAQYPSVLTGTSDAYPLRPIARPCDTDTKTALALYADPSSFRDAGNGRASALVPITPYPRFEFAPQSIRSLAKRNAAWGIGLIENMLTHEFSPRLKTPRLS
jgi:hypothetical protein